MKFNWRNNKKNILIGVLSFLFLGTSTGVVVSSVEAAKYSNKIDNMDNNPARDVSGSDVFINKMSSAEIYKGRVFLHFLNNDGAVFNPSDYSLVYSFDWLKPNYYQYTGVNNFQQSMADGKTIAWADIPEGVDLIWNDYKLLNTSTQQLSDKTFEIEQIDDTLTDNNGAGLVKTIIPEQTKGISLFFNKKYKNLNIDDYDFNVLVDNKNIVLSNFRPIEVITNDPNNPNGTSLIINLNQVINDGKTNQKISIKITNNLNNASITWNGEINTPEQNKNTN